MITGKKDIFKYEDGPYHKPFDFINNDLDLMFLLIFIEAAKAKKEELKFTDFFKGDCWDTDQVSNEIQDIHEYVGITDMLIEQIFFLFEDTRMGKVIEVGIDDARKAVMDLLIKTAEIGSANAKKEGPNYYYLIEELFFLGQRKTTQLYGQVKDNPVEAWFEPSLE